MKIESWQPTYQEKRLLFRNYFAHFYDFVIGVSRQKKVLLNNNNQKWRVNELMHLGTHYLIDGGDFGISTI